jgi:hypothetical protein
MTMPRFAAEASLYKTSGHYRTGGHINSSAQTGSRVWPAVREQGGEVIDVCEDDPSKCWPPPLTEPPVGGGDGWPPGGGPTDPGFGPGGGGGTPPGPRHCHRSDFGSEDEFELAVGDCIQWGGLGAYAWCIPQRGGGSKKLCCRKQPNGRSQCVPLSDVPHPIAKEAL